MYDDPIVRVVAKILTPAIMLYALYVQFHGDYGPGGGFQAGVILAAAFILNAIIFGNAQTRHIWGVRTNIILICSGVLIYGFTGVASIFRNGEFLNYSVLAAEPKTGQHIGILLVELGVGITVTATMVGLFFAFAGRLAHRRQIKQPISRDNP